MIDAYYLKSAPSGSSLPSESTVKSLTFAWAGQPHAVVPAGAAARAQEIVNLGGGTVDAQYFSQGPIDYAEKLRRTRWHRKVHLRFQGANGGTSFTDDGPNGYASPTVLGQAQLSDADSPFGGTSLLLDGNGDYLRWVGNPNPLLDPPTGDWTYAAWIKTADWPAGGTWRGIFGRRNTSGGDNWITYLQSDGSLRFEGEAGGVAIGPTVSIGAWHHVAVVRHKGIVTVYVDGSSAGGTPLNQGLDDNLDNLASQLDSQVGLLSYGLANNYFNGRIGELFALPDFALWTEDFTPPTDFMPTFAETEAPNVAHIRWMGQQSNSGSYSFAYTAAPGDYVLLSIETGAETFTVPAGWSDLGALSVSGTRVQLCGKLILTGDAGSVTIPDSGNHQSTLGWTLRGVDASDPIDGAAVFSSFASSTYDAAIPDITTTRYNTLVLMGFSTTIDAFPHYYGDFNAPDLDGVIRGFGQASASGNGGQQGWAAGWKETPGLVANNTARSADYSTQIRWIIALNSATLNTGTGSSSIASTATAQGELSTDRAGTAAIATTATATGAWVATAAGSVSVTTSATAVSSGTFAAVGSATITTSAAATGLWYAEAAGTATITSSATAVGTDASVGEASGDGTATITVSATAVSDLAQAFSPISTVSNTGWTPSSGVDLHLMVDDANPDDATTFISTNQTGAVCEVLLTDLPDPAVSDGYQAGFQFKGDGVSGLQIKLKDGTTLIKTWLYDPAPADWTIFEPELSGAEADSIGNHANLRYELTEV